MLKTHAARPQAHLRRDPARSQQERGVRHEVGQAPALWHREDEGRGLSCLRASQTVSDRAGGKVLRLLQCIALAARERYSGSASNSGKSRGRDGGRSFYDVVLIPRASEKFVGGAGASSLASAPATFRR